MKLFRRAKALLLEGEKAKEEKRANYELQKSLFRAREKTERDNEHPVCEVRRFTRGDELIGIWIMFNHTVDVPFALSYNMQKTVNLYARALFPAEILPPPTFGDEHTAIFAYLSAYCNSDVTDFRQDFPQFLVETGLITYEAIQQVVISRRCEHQTISGSDRSILGIVKNSHAAEIYDQYLYDLLARSTGDLSSVKRTPSYH